MDFQAQKDANVTVISISGRLDAVTVSEYEKKVRELIDGGEILFVVNFEQLDYISSAGLRGLLVMAKLLKAKGGQVRFANVNGGVREVFNISGFNSLFKIDDSVASAREALA